MFPVPLQGGRVYLHTFIAPVMSQPSDSHHPTPGATDGSVAGTRGGDRGWEGEESVEAMRAARLALHGIADRAALAALWEAAE